MKARHIAIAATLGATPLILAGHARAGFIGITLTEKSNPFGLLVYNIYAQFDERPDDFVFAVYGSPLYPMNMNVRGGTFYQNVFGGDTAPNPALFQIYPSLEYDTFVTIGAKTSPGDATTVGPGWPGFGADRMGCNDCGWFITPDDPQGAPNESNQVLLAQLATANGTGFFGNLYISGFDNGGELLAYVPFDTQFPAPPAAALLLAAGLFGPRRRRRQRQAKRSISRRS